MSVSLSSPDRPRTNRGRRIVRWLAAATLVAGIGFWIAKGARFGWNQDQVPVKAVDEFTGLEYVRYEPRFVPGYEWLATTCGVSVLLFGVSFLFRSTPSNSNP